jgi:hypothetical protein
MQEEVDDGSCRDEDVDVAVFNADGVGLDAVVVAAEAGAVFEGEVLFVEGAGDFGFVSEGADHAAGEGHLLAVRAHVVGGIPFAAALEVEDGDLSAFEQDAGAAVFGHVFDTAGEMPGGGWGGSHVELKMGLAVANRRHV